MKKGDKVKLRVTNTEKLETCTEGKIYDAVVEEIRGWHRLDFYTFTADNGNLLTVRETHCELINV